MGKVFVIAVVSAFDAGLIAAAVVLLGRPEPVRQLGAYLVGGMGFSIVFGLLIVLALHGTDVLHGLGRSTRAAIEIAAGALLVIVAIGVGLGRALQWHPRRIKRRQTDPRRQSPADRALGHDSLWIAWAAGAAYSLPGAEYLAGLALLAKLNAPTTANVLAILGFNLIMFALIELPLVCLVLVPDRARSLTEALKDWMTAHRRTVIIIVAGAGGAYLLISGLSDLS